MGRALPKLPLHEALEAFDALRGHLRFCSESGRLKRFPLTLVGSARRRSAFVHDIDALVTLPAGHGVQGVLSSADFGNGPLSPVRTFVDGDRKKRVRLCWSNRGKCVDVDLFLTTASEKPFALLHFTGSREYNIRLRALAKKKGLLLNQYGLFYSSGRRVSHVFRSEKDIVEFLESKYLPPSQR